MRNIRKHSKKYSKGSLHGALNKLHPRVEICENCGAKPERATHYSLIHGREYSLNREDYRELCGTCHGAYDNHQEDGIKCDCIDRGFYKHGWGYAKIPVLMNEKNCEFCGITLYTLRTDAKYCSDLCRGRATKQRKDAYQKAPMKHTSCQRTNCCNLLAPDVKYNTAYCSNACRQAVYNTTHADELLVKRTIEQEKRRKAKEKAEKKKQLKQQEQKSKDLADSFVEEFMNNGD